jgi:catechol 2,3-dioxygenase-like lactoylglutathione lyase family enzyme
VIIGAHVLLYSQDPEADRAFFRHVLGLRGVDIGHGWLIFKLPPSEAALHPAEENDNQIFTEGVISWARCST